MITQFPPAAFTILHLISEYFMPRYSLYPYHSSRLTLRACVFVSQARKRRWGRRMKRRQSTQMGQKREKCQTGIKEGKKFIKVANHPLE